MVGVGKRGGRVSSAKTQVPCSGKVVGQCGWRTDGERESGMAAEERRGLGESWALTCFLIPLTLELRATGNVVAGSGAHLQSPLLSPIFPNLARSPALTLSSRSLPIHFPHQSPGIQAVWHEGASRPPGQPRDPGQSTASRNLHWLLRKWGPSSSLPGSPSVRASRVSVSAIIVPKPSSFSSVHIHKQVLSVYCIPGPLLGRGIEMKKSVV